MGKALSLVLYLCGFLAGLAVFALAALDLTKNHFGVDTRAVTFAFGNDAGNWLVWAQDQFSIVLAGLNRVTGLTGKQSLAPIWPSALGLTGLLTAWVFGADVLNSLAGGASQHDGDD